MGRKHMWLARTFTILVVCSSVLLGPAMAEDDATDAPETLESWPDLGPRSKHLKKVFKRSDNDRAVVVGLTDFEMGHAKAPSLLNSAQTPAPSKPANLPAHQHTGSLREYLKAPLSITRFYLNH